METRAQKRIRLEETKQNEERFMQKLQKEQKISLSVITVKRFFLVRDKRASHFLWVIWGDL